MATPEQRPGLTLVVPGAAAAAAGQGLAPPQRGALERLLGRAAARFVDQPDLESTLGAAFGYPASTSDPLPVAPLTRLADTGRVDDQWWLRADPVHLQADRDRVIALGPRALALEAAEVQALGADLNAHFDTQQWWLEAPTLERWYLRIDDAPGVQFTSLSRVIGCDIAGCLPSGARSRFWQRMLTEVQMLLHQHPVNSRRESQGRPPVNGLWLWGPGCCPVSPPAAWRRVWAEEPLVRGLARHSATPLVPPPASFAEWLAGAQAGAHLVVLEGAAHARWDGDAHAWVEVVQALERNWFAPLLRALRGGAFARLELLPGDGYGYTLTPWDARCFWRRRQRLS